MVLKKKKKEKIMKCARSGKRSEENGMFAPHEKRKRMECLRKPKREREVK
jgi:hypothetical protein